MNWDSEIIEAVNNCEYDAVISFYESKLDHGIDVEDYVYLGLAYLLKNDEITAQLVWSMALAQSQDPESTFQINLVGSLKQEAIRQENHGNTAVVELIRQHIHDITPDDISNILELIQTKIKLKTYTPNILDELSVIQKLGQANNIYINEDLLSQAILRIINYPASLTVDFLRYSIPLVQAQENLVSEIKPKLFEYTYQKRLMYYAEAIAAICIKINPNDLVILKTQYYIQSELKKFDESFETAKRLYEFASDPISKSNASALLLSTAMQSGNWIQVDELLLQYKADIDRIESSSEKLNPIDVRNLLTEASLFLYCSDQAQENRFFHRIAANLLEKTVSSDRSSFSSHLALKKAKPFNQRIKVGYIAHTWRSHSVGWLCRWLFQHHDRSKFEIHIYFIDKNQGNQNCNNPFFKTWFSHTVDSAKDLGNDPNEIAATIQADEIDILVDLDSTTLGLTCHVMALKPAPIQLTWLGRDASGLSTIDYFIADPFVLPDNAEQYYQESIWRLPNTYVAVAGFETGVPSLRRQELGIPNDSTIYLSAQTGMKRHPDLIRLQMKILNQVPGSYFLIKGIANQEIIKCLFERIAKEEDVESNRLIFLQRDNDEYKHRANLQIADVVLDTYPYNGATTTLETLWMGIPMVTRVGEQFSARNSYTFMKNLGVEEGIAWTDAEYINWGIRLGKEPELRQQIALKLKQSRQTSPLWDVKAFAKDMETAYQEMWAKYLKELNISIPAD